MASSEPYILSLITPEDYLELAEISRLSFEANPLYSLTYPPGVSHEKIRAYLLGMIKFRQEGRNVKTIKAAHKQTIIGFATWFLGPKPQDEMPERPAGADFSFLDDLKEKMKQAADGIYNEDTDYSRF